MKIVRSTEVVSVSLTPTILQKMEYARKKEGRTRSGFITSLILRYIEDLCWQRIYKKGAETAQKFNIKSEADIDKILHAK